MKFPKRGSFHCIIATSVKKTFSNKSLLRNHKILVHGETPENIENLRPDDEIPAEISQNIPNRIKYAFGCYFCKEIFIERPPWEVHMKSDHGKNSEEIGILNPKKMKNIRIHNCEICDENFMKISLWEHHMRSVHEKTSEDIQTMTGYKNWCTICKKTYINLNQHIYLKHETHDKFECCICKGQFVANHVLKKHISSVHERLKPFLCTLCGQSFAQSYNLKTHLDTVHEKKKPFQCSYCEKAFSQKHTMTEHVFAVHEGTKELKCLFCDKIFPTETRRSRHEFTHENIRKFECSLCDAKFKRGHHLKTHMQTIHEMIK